jgi:ankyrin repeat protein
MKYLILGIFSCFTLLANAQRENSSVQTNNSLLNQAFWQARPGPEAVKAEVEKGNDPSQLNASSFDPVVLAINAGAPNESILYLMQQKGNDVNKLTHDGRTYIFWAANRGNVELMEYLISKGAKMDLQDSHGYTIINFAAATGQQNTSVYELCIQKGSDPRSELNHDGANALLLAAANDPELKLVQYFQSKGLDLKSRDAAGNTAFNYAARSGNIATMKLLLSKGVSHTDNALIMASQGSRRGANTLEVYQYLESLGIKPTVTSKSGDNVLHAIVRRPGQADIIRYFLGKGVNVNQVNEEGNTVFMNAAMANRDTSELASLLASTKDINRANKAGATALSLAVKSNSPESVQFLLNKGADIKAIDAKGNNLVYYLFESYTPQQAAGFDAKLKILQSKGLSIAAPQKDGSSLFHLAVAKNDLALLKRVQEFGADVNARNKEGLTALHKAAMMSKNDAMMKYLISIGAKKDLKTNFNETAYDLAVENEFLTKEKVSVDFLK